MTEQRRDPASGPEREPAEDEERGKKPAEDETAKDEDEIVDERSKESFPSSDPPAW